MILACLWLSVCPVATWSDVPTADGYVLEVGGVEVVLPCELDEGGGRACPGSHRPVPVVRYVDVPGGTPVQVRVASYNGAGVGPWSAPVTYCHPLVGEPAA